MNFLLVMISHLSKWTPFTQWLLFWSKHCIWKRRTNSPLGYAILTTSASTLCMHTTLSNKENSPTPDKMYTFLVSWHNLLLIGQKCVLMYHSHRSRTCTRICCNFSTYVASPSPHQLWMYPHLWTMYELSHTINIWMLLLSWHRVHPVPQ